MKNKKILFGIILLFVFLLSVGLTYAYFVMTINIEGEAKQILTSTGTLELLYNGGETISAEEIYPGWSRTKSFTVTNNGSLNIYYSINWESITNQFKRNELVMSMTCTGEGCATISEEPVGKTDGPFIDTIKIVPGVTHTYELTITFIETGSVQNYNQGKTFNGVISVAESDGYFDMYGTLVNASDLPIAGATVSLHSSPRTAVTDENGNFMFEDVEADNHTLSATIEGEELLSDSLTIINGEKTEITNTTVTRRTKSKQINVKVKAGSDRSIASLEEIHYTLSPSWATRLNITNNQIIAIAVETTLESPSTYTYNGVTYNRSKNGVDVSENIDGSVLASTYSDGINERIVMINSRGATSLPQDSSHLFSDSSSNSNCFNVLEYIETESLDTSQVTDMESMFYKAGCNSTTFNLDLSGWDTSNVEYMSMMLRDTGQNATTFDIGNLGQWNTSKVTRMLQMFSSAGKNATTWNIGNLSNWDTSKVNTMLEMFYDAGKNATTWSIGDLSNWNTSQVEGMTHMFWGAGKNSASWDIGDIGEWDTSQVIGMSGMFYQAGYNATTFNLDLSNWNTSQVKYMDVMFRESGYNATTWSIGNVNIWDVSNVTMMDGMFNSAGYNATTFNLDLCNWNTSQVENMYYMFYSTGYNSTTFNLDLSNWNTSHVKDTNEMFKFAGKTAITFNLDLSNWNILEVTSMRNMFSYAGMAATSFTLNIKGFNLSSTNTTLTNYSDIFDNSNSNAQIIVGSQASKDWILGLSSSNRPSTWTSSNIVIN